MLSKVGKDKVSVWNSQYKVNIIPLGNLLLKVIIREIHLDTNRTTTSIRTKLSALDAYISIIGCNITKFNTHVKLVLAGLSARGETSIDLLTNVFKRYKSVSYSVFIKYIERKQEDCEDGQDLTPIALMILADNKFKILKLKGELNARSFSEEKILALQAEIPNLEKRTSMRYHNVNKSKTKKKLGKESREKPTCLKKNIKPEESESKIRTWNDTA